MDHAQEEQPEMKAQAVRMVAEHQQDYPWGDGDCGSGGQAAGSQFRGTHRVPR